MSNSTDSGSPSQIGPDEPQSRLLNTKDLELGYNDVGLDEIKGYTLVGAL